MLGMERDGADEQYTVVLHAAEMVALVDDV